MTMIVKKREHLLDFLISNIGVTVDNNFIQKFDRQIKRFGVSQEPVKETAKSLHNTAPNPQPVSLALEALELAEMAIRTRHPESPYIRDFLYENMVKIHASLQALAQAGGKNGR